MTDLASRVTQALQLHKDGSLHEAIDAYQSVLEEGVPPVLATQILSNMGAIYSSRGEYESAVSSFEAAIKASPDNASGHFNLAVIQTSKLGHHKAALRSCRAALKLSPEMPKGLHLMGNILQSLGLEAEAQGYFIRAEELASTSSSTSTSSTSSTTAEIDWNTVLAASKIGSFLSTVVDGREFLAECVSERPLVFLARAFLDGNECAFLRERARPLFEKSFVMGGKGDVIERTSENCWLPANDTVTQSVQRRLSGLLQVGHAALSRRLEDLQVVRYESGGFFRMHHDSSAFHKRTMTALIYINSVDSGGETFFPYAPGHTDYDHILSTEESIASGLEKLEKGEGFRFEPSQGSALLFFNHNLRTNSIDTAAVHAGMPVKSGEKWVCNYWLD